MNKIKTLYDMVQTLKAQETFAGVMKANVEKDEVVVVDAENTFEKDLAAGTMKGSFKSEVNHEGCKMKHESEYEFDKKSCGGHGHHGFHHGQGMGKRRHMMHMMHEMEAGADVEGTRPHHGRSMKGKLNKISMALDLLNRLNIEDGDNGSKTLNLKITLADLPEEIKSHMQHKIMCKAGHGPHGEHMKDIKSVEAMELDLRGTMNAENELKSLSLRMTGKYSDDEEQIHIVKVKGDVDLK